MGKGLGWAESLDASEVVILKSGEMGPYNLAQEGFQQVLGAKGRVYTLGDLTHKRKELITQIMDRHPPLVYLIGTPAAELAAWGEIPGPVVLSIVIRPGTLSTVEGPVVSCLALPSPEDYFRSLQRIYPRVQRIGTVYDPRQTGFLVNEGRKAAKALNLDLIAVPVSSTKEAIKGLDKIKRTIDALWMLPDSTVLKRQSLEYMMLLSFRHRIPLVAVSKKYVKKGAFMALGVDYQKIGQQSGQIAIQMLHGPLSRKKTTVFAKDFEIIINLKTAKKLRIEIPADLLKEAIVVK